MSDDHATNCAEEDPSPSPRACRAEYRSVADLCADHENLREYIAQLERERDAFGDELAARDKKSARLSDLVRSAYNEGWSDGLCSNKTQEENWIGSQARREVDHG
jgi:hypothetical protein